MINVILGLTIGLTIGIIVGIVIGVWHERSAIRFGHKMQQAAKFEYEDIDNPEQVIEQENTND
jgi:uncharacterized membrane-anchored protein YhcB (DUF1043 family)